MYPSDLSDSEWEKIELLFRVDYSKGGRPLKYSKRQMLNAIFYIAKQGANGDFFQEIILLGEESITISEDGDKKEFLKN